MPQIWWPLGPVECYKKRHVCVVRSQREKSSHTQWLHCCMNNVQCSPWVEIVQSDMQQWILDTSQRELNSYDYCCNTIIAVRLSFSKVALCCVVSCCTDAIYSKDGCSGRRRHHWATALLSHYQLDQHFEFCKIVDPLQIPALQRISAVVKTFCCAICTIGQMLRIVS